MLARQRAYLHILEHILWEAEGVHGHEVHGPVRRPSSPAEYFVVPGCVPNIPGVKLRRHGIEVTFPLPLILKLHLGSESAKQLSFHPLSCLGPSPDVPQHV